MTTQRLLYRFLVVYFPQWTTDRLENAAVDSPRKFSFFRYFFVDDSLGVPRAIIIVTGFFTILCTWLPYGVLIESSTLLSCPALVLMSAAYVRLKIRHREKFPFCGRLSSWPAVLLVAGLPAVCFVTQAVLSCLDEAPVLGVPYFKVVAMVVVIGTWCVCFVGVGVFAWI
jgi:hypothetical protein